MRLWTRGRPGCEDDQAAGAQRVKRIRTRPTFVGRGLLCALICAVVVVGAIGAARGQEPTVEMPRVSVRDGGFVLADSGDRWVPLGFNYIRLGGRRNWHVTFAPGMYDGPRATTMLGQIHGDGFNVVRVFIDPYPGEGIAPRADRREFSSQYVGNLLDFLQRARQRDVHVVMALCDLPPSYRPGGGPPQGMVGRGNRIYLTVEGIAAKAQYVGDVVSAVATLRPDLLPTVFAYELDNETYLQANQPPFSLREGTITGANGQVYDLSDAGQQQRLADDHVVLWADACVDAIKRVDPGALVSVNVFSYHAVHRGGPGTHFSDRTLDGRMPARLLALTRSRLDYLDIHLYPHSSSFLAGELRSIEWDALSQAARKAGKPIICGEFGAFRSAFSTEGRAARGMKMHLQRLRKAGLAGWLFWTYDSDEQAGIWNAKSGEGSIYRVLVDQARRWAPPPTAATTRPATEPTERP
ncbi:MAG: cellulase family glycosylhydrolase [Phycisphaeraceae bacterium]|nr:cellulase family glycosylhydrolase [Phycisphaeraceae bacterium]